MKESVFIKHHDPEASKVISSNPHKLVLEDTYYEFYTRSNVISPDEETGLSKEWNIDSRAVVLKKGVIGIEQYYANNKKCPAININASDGSATILFETKQEATDVYNLLFKWLTT